jgi:3-hydroxybutyryl-CoA dehydratase
MAQAEIFETDFWKDANLRKMWDDIVPRRAATMR